MTVPIDTSDAKVRSRFESYVERRGDDDCWLWNGTRVKSGHGQLWAGTRHIAAHRYALAMAGVNVDGKMACHRCANPRCVNPKHLYAGTAQDNINDAIESGIKFGNPAPKGEANYCAKLTEKIVAEVRRRYVPRDKWSGTRALSREFNVNQNTISKIVRGLTWQP